MRSVSFLLALACFGLVGQARAAQRNDVPSCYSYADMSANQPAPTGRELVVIIDQTTPLSADLRRTALNAALRFVQPGDEVLIYQFSAYMADSYMRLPFEGRMEAPIKGSQRDEIGMDSLRKLDRCLGQQQTFFAKLFTSKFDASVGTPSTRIAKSEIMFSLRQIADDLSKRPASHRVVLLVSDLLENSDFGSFYARNALRTIDPSAELKKAETNHLFAHFGGARVYVHAAGLVPADSKSSYRSGTAVEALRQFWTGYFEHSNATLEAFGAPSLTADLQ
jgi:hypothetical protein